MKIVLWIGSEANQKALANKINSIFPVSGIVVEVKNHKPQITITKVIEKIIEKLLLPSIGNAWWGMLNHFKKNYPHLPTAKTVTVENINSDIAYHFTDEIKPDLIIVSGTRLIRERMLSLTPRIGILNLHTGLSPYVKGGPNCTNWCIATKQFHLIGNTVMWIDPGIDSGNIVTTEFTEFAGTENLLDIHIKVMEHAHRLYLKAIDRLSKGNHQGVQQSKIAEGKTYFTRQWRLKEKFMLVKNLKAFRETINSPLINKLRNSVTIIPI